MGKLDRILVYWQQYIALVPNDSRAYLERSGTYFHNQDFHSAKKDAKKALDLGNKSAQPFYEKLVELTK